MIELYEANARERIGFLTPDVISCSVTEECNGIYELEMEYPATAMFYKDIQLRRIIRTKPNPFDPPEMFRIMSIERKMKDSCTINAVHISYDLNGIVVAPYHPEITDPPAYIGKLTHFRDWAKEHHYGELYDKIENCIVIPSDIECAITISEPTPLRSVLASLNDNGDVVEFKFEGQKCYIYKNGSRGKASGITIEYGKNMLDLDQSEDCNELYSGIYPYWLGDGVYKAAGKIVRPDGYSPGFDRLTVLDCSEDFDEAPSEADLIAYGKAYFSRCQLHQPDVTITVSYLDLAPKYEGFYEIRLCDTVKIKFPLLGVDVTAKCVKTVYDPLTDRYSSIDIGDVLRKSLDLSLYNRKG